MRVVLRTAKEQRQELNEPGLPKFIDQVSALEIELTDTEPDTLLESLVAASDKTELVRLLVECANRCISGLRYQGGIHNLHELSITELDTPGGLLGRWQAEFTNDDKTWTKFNPGSLLPPPFLPHDRLTYKGWGFLQPMFHEAIEEAIQEYAKPKPEAEFTTNARDHVAYGNLRLALLESVIGLEIVLARFLERYLEQETGLSKSKLTKFLNPSLGLYARVSVVLALTLRDTQSFDQQKILTAISWRNSITHKTGHLPGGLSEDTIKDHISAVINLTTLLALREQQLELKPKLAAISERFMKKHQTSYPSISFLGGHAFTVGISVYDPSFIKSVEFDVPTFYPTIDTINECVSTLTRELSGIDSRFHPNRHLTVTIDKILVGTKLAIWSAGKCTMFSESEEQQET